MRILINQYAAFGARTGIGHYTRELLRGLHGLAEREQIDVFPRGILGRATRLAATIQRPRGGALGTNRTTSTAWIKRCGKQVLGLAKPMERMLMGPLFRRVCKPGQYDVYHEPNYLCHATEVPTVVTLHDLSAILHPEWHPADRAALHQKHLERTLRQARHFVTVSEAACREMIDILGIAPERITVTYNGVRPGLTPLPADEVAPVLARLGLPPRYLLHVGTIEPRKNVLMLLKAYCSLPAVYREAWPLVLVGGWGWKADDVAEFYRREARHKNVRHVGYVGDDHLAAVYNGARALVFPSHYEGFGLPPVEMLACGGAVLASTAAAVAETVGRQAHLIPASDEAGWRQALERILVDDDWCNSLRKGAPESVRRFTWERCARRTLDVYRQVNGKSQLATAA